MLAIEMKSCGAYLSRSLSFKQAEVRLPVVLGQVAELLVWLIKSCVSVCLSVCDIVNQAGSNHNRYTQRPVTQRARTYWWTLITDRKLYQYDPVWPSL